MEHVETFPAIFYLCPNCQCDNTIRITLSQRLPWGKCRKCRSEWTLMSLAEAYEGWKLCKQFYILAQEFICDNCGRNNVILNKANSRTMTFVDNDPAEAWKPEEERDRIDVSLFNARIANLGYCRYCSCSYTLHFIMPK